MNLIHLIKLFDGSTLMIKLTHTYEMIGTSMINFSVYISEQHGK
jgi:hypothetical protein